MCGLTGYMDIARERPAEMGILERMTRTLVHRGPDADGYFLENETGFGFRRLRIIDLETGDQPLFNEDRSVVMMCNGEIYNYRELRQEMIAKGHRFQTNTDVEVLVHLYEEYEFEFLNRLNGQFAFVIYDRKKKRLFTARDHFGINPFYYTVADGVLVFGSEIKAILQHPLVRPDVDLTGLDQLLSFPGTVSPRTMFKGIHHLPGGHALRVEDGQIHEWEYWDLDYPLEAGRGPEKPENYYVERLSELFSKAVEYRLQADVPVGFYLSGGLDSSMIAAMGVGLTRDQPRATYSIAFSDREINESRYQRIMAEYLKTEHHETLFDWSEIANRMEKMIYHCECPVKESFNTCAMALSESARRGKTTVVLAGQGADELFAGYMGYRFDQSKTRDAGGFDLERVMEDELREKLWGDPSIFYEKEQNAYRELKRAIYSREVNERFPQIDCLGFDLVNREMLKGRHILHQRSYLDVKLRLQDHLLSEHGDRMIMMHSVEGRYPFLDIDLIAFAREIPPNLKLNGYDEKYILKKIAGDLIPREVNEREKFGFRAPSSAYLLRQNIDWVGDLLSPDRVKRQGYFNPEVVARLKTQYSDPSYKFNPHLETDWLMVVLTFGLFLELFGLPDLR